MFIGQFSRVIPYISPGLRRAPVGLSRLLPAASAALAAVLVASPQTIEKIIPNWQTTLGPIILLLAALALLSLVFRSFLIVVQFAFWLAVIAIVGKHTGLMNSQLAERLTSLLPQQSALPSVASIPEGWVDIFSPVAGQQADKPSSTEEATVSRSASAKTQSPKIDYVGLFSGIMPADNGSHDRFISESSLPDSAYFPRSSQGFISSGENTDIVDDVSGRVRKAFNKLH